MHPIFEQALGSLLRCTDCGVPGAKKYGMAGYLCTRCAAKLEEQLKQDRMDELALDAKLERDEQVWDGDEDR